jgi:uncharacterized protein YecE (DUF72 family)
MGTQTHIGTSGFSYAYWKNRFYPEKLAASEWLEYYSTQFDTLELNNTFYRFPDGKALEKMAARTPEHFVFSVKAHKVITHTLRLKDAAEKIREFEAIVTAALGAKLGCLLFQLPPSFAYTEENMARVLDNIPPGHQRVIEFRHASWWQDTVFAQLRAAQLSMCSVSYPGLPETPVLTTDLFYQRMHGVPKLFASAYDDEALQSLAAQLPAEATQRFIYFNNTMFEAGYTNARSMKELL